MITEDLLKIVLKYIFCEVESTNEKDVNDYKANTKSIVFNNIKKILDHYDNKEKPLNITELFNVIKTIIDKIIKNNYSYNKDILKDSLNISETISDYINFITQNKITYYEYIQIIYHISYRDKYVKIFKEKDEYLDFVKSIEDGKFLDINKTVQKYEELLNKIYFDFSLNKDNLIDDSNLISNKNFPTEVCINKDITKIFEDMKKYYSSTLSVRSGFKCFDDNFSLNGFESGRLYLGASMPGFGKSLWLLSSMVKSCKFYDTKEGKKELIENKKNLYIYITAENQIYETINRYASMAIDSRNINLKELIYDDISECENELFFKNSVVEIKYVSAYNTTTGDIMVLIDKIKAKYDSDKYILRCVYVDYLDLFKSMTGSDLYRLELGFVTMELKNISIKYNTPVVTVTQINTYEKIEKPNLGILKESKAKGENADCVFLIQENSLFNNQNNDSEKIINIHILKNRGYKKGIYHLYINYDYKKLIGCTLNGICDKRNEYIDSYLSFASRFKKLYPVDPSKENNKINNNNNNNKNNNTESIRNFPQPFEKIKNKDKSEKNIKIVNQQNYNNDTSEIIINDTVKYSDF